MVRNDELRTKDDLCEKFQVSMPTLNKWIESGKLRPIRLGKLVRFTHKAVKEFLNEAGK